MPFFRIRRGITDNPRLREQLKQTHLVKDYSQLIKVTEEETSQMISEKLTARAFLIAETKSD